jgi:hypothetical protein
MNPRPHPSALEHCVASLISAEPGCYSLTSIEGQLYAAPIAGLCCVDCLVGLRADPGWAGISLVAAGVGAVDPIAASESGAHNIWTPQSGVEMSLRLAFGMLRDDSREFAARPESESEILRLEPEHGFVVDVCRRFLGLPTAPEPRSVLDYLTALWLQEVLDRSADPVLRTPISAAEVLECHPLISNEVVDFGASIPSPRGFAHLIAHTSSLTSWERMRAHAERGLGSPHVSAAEAKWMDEGIFARWMLNTERPPSDLLDDISLFVPARTYDYLNRAVGYLDSLGFAPMEGDLT